MGTLTFGLIDGFEILITDLAREALFYKYDGEQAVKILIESFPTMSKDIALKIISGELVIKVLDKGNITVEKGLELFNFDKWFKINVRYYVVDYHSDEDGFYSYHNYFMNNVFRRIDKINTYFIPSKDIFGYSNIEKDFTYRELYKILISNDQKKKDLLQEYALSCDVLERDLRLLSTLNELLEECNKLNKAISFIETNFNHKFDRKLYDSKFFEILRIHNILTNDIPVKEDDSLEKFLDAEIKCFEIEEIEPSSIDVKYDASWISPEGEYFGMNGEIANMLHNKLADLINERHIKLTGKSLVEDSNINVDAVLCDLGWARIHGNRVMYDGYLMDPIIHMTDKQKEAIYKYCQIHHRGIICCNYNEPITAARFSMTDKNSMCKLFKI